MKLPYAVGNRHGPYIDYYILSSFLYTDHTINITPINNIHTTLETITSIHLLDVHQLDYYRRLFLYYTIKRSRIIKASQM